MTLRRVAWSFAVVLACAGCGGGGNDADENAPPPLDASATCALPDFAASALARLNQARAQGADCGSEGRFGAAPALAWNGRLAAAAAAHSADMAARDYFAHVSPDGATLAERVDAQGYAWSALAENIAAGQRSIDEVVSGWIDSDGHCANVMNPALRDVGMACVRSDSARYPTYWTLDFGRAR